MKSLYFCYECGSTIKKTSSNFDCPECNKVLDLIAGQMVSFNYDLEEFMYPVFESDGKFFWKETLNDTVYLVALPSNYGMIPRSKMIFTYETNCASIITIEDIS